MAASARRTIGVSLGDPIDRADVAASCNRLRARLERCDADLVVCDVGTLTAPDAGTIDAVARIQLTALRLGRHLRLRHASPELRELLTVMGLRGVVPCCGSLSVETRWQIEEREESRGVEEEGDPADPTA